MDLINSSVFNPWDSSRTTHQYYPFTQLQKVSAQSSPTIIRHAMIFSKIFS